VNFGGKMMLCREDKHAPNVAISAVVRMFHILDTCNESHTYNTRPVKIKRVTLATFIHMGLMNTTIKHRKDYSMTEFD
jgi:hypothetical protein